MAKNIAIFCDGTWNSADQSHGDAPCPTNVVKLALRVAKSSGGLPQVSYYGQGVGTGGSLDRLTGGAFGHGLVDNLFEAYRFLILNYEPGDQLYFFGFSRGAYTARSLAGMIRKCGILSLSWAHKYRSALALYCDDQHPDSASPAEFRNSFCASGGLQIPIQCIGVWDTVGSLGIPIAGLRALTASKYQFHDVELSGSVKNAFHALAIDEFRGPFCDARWTYKPKPGQRVEQVWFAGAHSDVGGGYPVTESGLSDIALEWMIERASSTGLKFDQGVQNALQLRSNPLAQAHNSRKGLYRLSRAKEREIGTRRATDRKDNVSGESPALDPTQSIHASVLRRWDEDPKYRPNNLRTYFTRTKDPRGAP